MSDNVLNFSKNKKYTNIKELIKDMQLEDKLTDDGILILFNKDGEMQVMPCCAQSQCSYAAADLLKKAAE